MHRFISTIPRVKRELRIWAEIAQTIPDPLRTQALSSIEHKTFHCIGGSVYAHYPGADVNTMIRLIVAYQTISDYLDNLCDRMEVNDPRAFRLLHRSIMNALTPGASLEDYYALYPHSEKRYLPSLVLTCQELLLEIPHYQTTHSFVLNLAELYCELQVLKHVTSGGEGLLRRWFEEESKIDIQWNEWAAACGSTLGIFLLFALGFNSSRIDKGAILEAYFPWVQGLHILLDYLIDLGEDKESGDLNFITFYPSKEARDASLSKFVKETKCRIKELPEPGFHRTVVDGLIALYGSDPKVRRQNQQNIIVQMAGDSRTLFLLDLCKALRRLKVV